MQILLLIVLGLGCLVLGAEATVRGARSLGLRVGLPPVVVGLTIVAYGTSTPELVVSTSAAIEGHDGIALGNVVGSNIGNALLILGLCAVVRPIETHARILQVEAPLLVGLSAVVLLWLASGCFGRLAGAMLVAGLVAYTMITIRLARRESPEVEAEFANAQPDLEPRVWGDVAWCGVGLVLLVVGGVLFVDGATLGASALGVSPSIVGLTVVAVGTSLPELASSLVASLRGHGDIAVGNVIGSNIFNLLGVLGFATLVDPISSSDVGLRDLFAMLASAIAILAFLRTRGRLERWEGAVLLCGYAVYLYGIIP